MLFGGLIFAVAGEHGTQAAAAAVIPLAICGNLAAARSPTVDASALTWKVQWNLIPESLAIPGLTRSNSRCAMIRLLGVSWFWFTGTVLTGNCR